MDMTPQMMAALLQQQQGGAPDSTQPGAAQEQQQQRAMMMLQAGMPKAPGLGGGIAGGLQNAMMMPGVRQKLAAALQSGKGGTPPAPGGSAMPDYSGG